MKRSTASWTTAVAASALLALPVGSWAQQPAPSTTPRQQTTGAPAPQTGRTPGAETNAGVRERASASGAIGTRRHSRGVADWHGEDSCRRAEAALECPRTGGVTETGGWRRFAAQRELERRRRCGRSHPERAARSREHHRRDHAGSRGHDRFDGDSAKDHDERQACRLDSARRAGALQASGGAHPTHGVRRGHERRGCEPELGPDAEH